MNADIADLSEQWQSAFFRELRKLYPDNKYVDSEVNAYRLPLPIKRNNTDDNT